MSAKLYRVETAGEWDLIVADSHHAAVDFSRKNGVLCDGDPDDDVESTGVGGDDLIQIRNDAGHIETKTARAWVAESRNPSIIGSTQR